MTTAQDGAAALVAHLESTGTGASKLDVARAAPLDTAKTARDGAQAVVNHLRASGVGEGTLAKAEKYVAGLAETAAAKKSADDKKDDGDAKKADDDKADAAKHGGHGHGKK